MELDQLLDIWKRQDSYSNAYLQKGTLHMLLKQKSKGVLDQIIKKLTLELVVILAIGISFNFLYFMIDLPYTLGRWSCFAIFNLLLLAVSVIYSQTILKTKNARKADLATSLAKIIDGLNNYQNKSRYLQLPIGIICLLAFAGAQQLLYWLPWMMIEFFLWKWAFRHKINKRFESYLSELEYSLKSLKDS